MPADSPDLVDQFQLKIERSGDGLQVRQLHIAALLDVADRCLIGNAGQFGQCVPSQSLRFAGRADLGRNARR